MSLCLFDHFAVLFFAEKRRNIGSELACLLLYGSAVPEKLRHLHKLHLSLVVACLTLFKSHIRNEYELLAEVVECDDLIEKHQVYVLEALGVVHADTERLLGISEEIIGEVACETSRKCGEIIEIGTSVF